MVGQDQEECIYKSNIFILTLLGGERRIRKELYEIKNSIYKNNELLPFKVFLIRFDRLVANEKVHNAFEPDTFFKDLEWAPSFETNLWARLHSVRIGILDGSFQSCKEKFLAEKTLS